VACSSQLNNKEAIMQRPLKITSRNFPLNEAFEAEIRQKSTALENFYESLIGCEVTVQAPTMTHHRKGGPFVVRIRLTVPGGELTVDHQEEQELSQAIREAFDAARRQLEDYAREQRGSVKTHEP
jgi:ribosome-associated translation inhibitor RaiA